jgi:hypothetical protein
MAIRYLKKYAALEGVVSVDDAEALVQWIQKQPSPAVHLGKCEHVHGAVLQVLMALRPRIAALPADPLLAAVLERAIPGRAEAPTPARSAQAV